MSIEAQSLPCFLVEWYRSELTAAPLADTAARLEVGVEMVCAEGACVQLLLTLAVPADDVLFGVFAADSDHAVSEACRRAGFPAERLSSAIDARVAGNA